MEHTHRTPDLVVDMIIRNKEGRVYLIKPGNKYFNTVWAFPGGHVEYGETVEDAARREAKEETGLDTEIVTILGVYSDPKRDPRAHKTSVAFILDAVGGVAKAADDAIAGRWVDPMEAPDVMAYDHRTIMTDYIEWLCSGGTFWSTMPRVTLQRSEALF